jgi:hypothetical protein
VGWTLHRNGGHRLTVAAKVALLGGWDVVDRDVL